MKEIKTISAGEFKNLLNNQQRNILVFGTAGIGRPAIVQKFIEQRNKEAMTKNYFKNKYNTISHVEKYIDLLIKYNMPQHKIDTCLRLIEYDVDILFLQALLGKHIADEIAELRKETPYKYGKHAIKGGE